ncbi:hypothetical protein EYF80_063112 [Liparis tanakae]|uniref:Uncharacterized protein n=1 Tax=Liparis tanakae TaxID=230148 RepID=A0A4Z2EDD1_9TELE|nr:hypothetical protein EYF80_063112 [Liparis tanakae]
MVLLCVLRSGRFSLAARLTRSCGRAGRPAAGTRRAAPRPPLASGVTWSRWSPRLVNNGSSAACRLAGPGPGSPARPGPVLRAHLFHTSAPARAPLPAPLVWLLLKPLQKLAAIILGRCVI